MGISIYDTIVIHTITKIIFKCWWKSKSSTILIFSFHSFIQQQNFLRVSTQCCHHPHLLYYYYHQAPTIIQTPSICIILIFCTLFFVHIFFLLLFQIFLISYFDSIFSSNVSFNISVNKLYFALDVDLSEDFMMTFLLSANFSNLIILTNCKLLFFIIISLHKPGVPSYRYPLFHRFHSTHVILIP